MSPSSSPSSPPPHTTTTSNNTIVEKQVIEVKGKKEPSLILRDYDNDEMLYPIDDTLLASLQAQKERLVKNL